MSDEQLLSQSIEAPDQPLEGSGQPDILGPSAKPESTSNHPSFEKPYTPGMVAEAIAGQSRMRISAIETKENVQLTGEAHPVTSP